MVPFAQLPFERIPERPRRAHGYFESAARTVSLDSDVFGPHDVHVRELGSGEPLLLIHGLMTTSYSWRFVLEPLAKRFRVIAPDMVGCGASGKPLGKMYSARNLGRWVGELQRALGVRGCVVVGNSLGGLVCKWLALDDPDAMRLLVDIHSPVFPEPRYTALAVALATPGAKALLRWMIRRDPLRWAHRNVHYFDETLKSLEEAHAYGDPLESDEGARAFVHYLSDAVAPSGFRAIAARLEALAREGTELAVPLKLVYARRDPMVSPSNGERMSRLFPRTEMVWLEESSHFPQVDSPDELVRHILRWAG
jgi:pimeloyl-ACP methyl ester carboxylesterase